MINIITTGAFGAIVTFCIALILLLIYGFIDEISKFFNVSNLIATIYCIIAMIMFYWIGVVSLNLIDGIFN